MTFIDLAQVIHNDIHRLKDLNFIAAHIGNDQICIISSQTGCHFCVCFFFKSSIADPQTVIRGLSKQLIKISELLVCCVTSKQKQCVGVTQGTLCSDSSGFLTRNKEKREGKKRVLPQIINYYNTVLPFLSAH